MSGILGYKIIIENVLFFTKTTKNKYKRQCRIVNCRVVN